MSEMNNCPDLQSDWGPRSDDRVSIFGDEYVEYLETYHPGTGAMVAMGCEPDMGLDASGLYYGEQGGHMTQIGLDASGLSYDDGMLMTQIGGEFGYDMYSEYKPNDQQFAPYMGFGPSMAQTDYPHGPFDEPDMGFEFGRRIPGAPGGGGMDTRGAAVNAGLAAGGAAVGLHFGGPPGALLGAAVGGAVRSLLGR